MKKALLAILAAGGLVLGAGPASAALIYKGSWILGNGPFWQTNPQVVSGQEEAAAMFGGSAVQYEISTVDANAANIDNMAWVDTLGINTSKVAQDFSHSDCGGGYNCATGSAASAYVLDHTCANRFANLADPCSGDGTQFVNYAFFNTTAVAAPEPSSLLLIGTMAVGLGLFRRRFR